MTPAVTLACILAAAEGYGSMSEYLALGMSAAGACVNLRPLRLDRRALHPKVLALLESSVSDAGGPVLYSTLAQSATVEPRPTFVHTMWASSRIPRPWVRRLNEVTAVLAPTRFVADLFRRCGVRRPIHVTPDGVDPQLYPYLTRPRGPSVTTLIVGTWLRRKHIAEGIAGWRLAFGDDPNARLLITTRPGDTARPSRDPRIQLINDPEPIRGIAHRYAQADVLLALGSEGFGLPLVEGMATGLPVIVLDSEGQSDICREVPELVLAVPAVRTEPCRDVMYGDVGVRGVPGPIDIAARLRWVADHRDEATDLGRAASAWVHRNRNAWAKGPLALQAMESHVGALH